VEERERRLGLNEAMFREVNERVEGMNQTFASVTGSFDIFCECSQLTCTERITVPTEIYERVRSDATHFLLRAGHEDPTVENVVETFDVFVIVEKEGVEVERVAEATDPRRDENE
jgi:biotin carboxylase